MKLSPWDLAIPSVTATLAVVLLALWLSIDSPLPIELRKPGMDGAPDLQNASAEASSPIPGTPSMGEGTPSDVTGLWSGFRGNDRDGISDEQPALLRQWPTGGPPELWRITLCEGYASPAIVDGRLYVLDYDEGDAADVVRCLSLDDGREIWNNGYHVAVTRNHGITRTVPVIVDDSVITLGPRCHLACWDLQTGESRWLLDLPRDYQAVVPRWYAGQCPLVDEDRLIVAVGGRSLMIAIDCESGEVVWECDNPRGWEMTHVSVVPMDHAGKRVYVYCGSGGIAGVDASTGDLLWDTLEWPVQFAHAPSPLPLPGGRFMVSSGYGNQVGAMILKINEAGDGVTVERRLSPREFNSEQQTPIFHEGHVFGVRKRGGGVLVCMDPSGEEIWNSGRDRFGHGPYLVADGLIFVLSDGGTLTMIEADPARYKPLATAEIFQDGHDAWGPLAMVQGRLILRDLTRMACLDLRASTKETDDTKMNR